MKLYLKHFFIFSLVILQTSCGFKISSKGSNSGNLISGIISPLIGSIAENNSRALIFQTAFATTCADPVYAKLYALKDDGSIDESSPLITQQVGSNARYSFDTKSAGISTPTTNVQYIVKAEGCNGDIYKRPVTNFDSKQDLDAKSTIVAEVVNASSLLNKTLNEVSRAKVELLINSVSGNSTSDALTSLTTQQSASSQFTEIFGTSPLVIQNARPEVNLSTPTSTINELVVNTFQATAFHVDPTYSIAYVWKIDGVVKSTSASWSYIPTANNSGNHSVDLYVGKDNGSGGIDLTKPYYTKNFSIIVNNNVLPTPPNISLNINNPSPVNSNTLLLDLATGVSLANCTTFSHLAITDTSTPPGVMQFSIDCLNSGTQTESITFTSGDGNKTLYIWAIDNAGNISNPKMVSLILDTQAPILNLNFAPVSLKGGSTHLINFTANDAGAGLNTLELYFSTDNGSSYSLLSNLSNTDSSYSWTTPTINSANAKIKIVATDLTTSSTIRHSNTFTIDSTAPSSPTINRTSPATSNLRAITLNATCISDYDKIFFSQSGTTPTIDDVYWEPCNTTKNFTVTSGDGLKTIYAFTKDIVGNISNSSNVTMTLDTTPPALPVATLVSPSVSSTSLVTFTITDCMDRPYVHISESMTSPNVNDSNWQVCTTSEGATNYTLVGPILQGTHNLYIYAKDSAGNISASSSASIIYDTTNPILNLSTSLASLYKGGDSVTLNFSASDINGLSSLKLYYAADGFNYVLAATLTNNSTTHNWNIPSENTNNAKLRIVAIDNATSANSASTDSTAFSIDSAAPSAPVIARNSSGYSTNNAVTINTTCIADYYQILYTETSSPPSLTNLNWETCEATKIFNTSTSDGLKTIYAFTRDTAGNISISSNIIMTLDTTLPTLTLTSLNSGGIFQGGSSQNITWTASDANLASLPVSISYSIDGSTYTTVANNIANSGAYSWVLPLIDSATVTLKLAILDHAGNLRTVISNNFSIDSTAPTITSFSLANGTTSVALPSVPVQINSLDSGAGLYQMRISENSTYSNDSWQVYSSASGSYSLSMISGNKSVYVWVKDQVGNVSNSSTTNINLDIGNPPIVSITAPTSSGGPYTSGDNIHIEWSCSSVNGLSANPVRIKYTIDDGATFVVATGWLPNNLTATTGSYDWTLPGGITVFRLLVECNSAAGVVSSIYSSPLNTNGWSVFAGDPANMSENVSASLALMIKGSSGFQTMAVDKFGNIYFSKNSVMMKVDSQTGLVTRFAGDPSSNSCNMLSGSDPLNSSNNRIGNSFSIFGMNQARDSIIFGACSKVWSLNTSTRALTLINSTSAYNGTPWYFSKSGNLFYANNGFVYKLNFNLVNQSPVVIMGNGTCSPTTSVAGTDALASSVPGINAGGCSGETYLFTNSDDTKIWIGCWNGVSGCQNSARADLDEGQNKFVIASNNLSWAMQDWDLSWCSTSYVTNRVWCSSRHSTSYRSYFDTQTETWTKTALGKNVFIRYAAGPAGMVSLSSDNYLNSYIENNDNSISIGQIGGSDIETYGNGSDFKKLAFSAVEDISYSSGLNSLFIDTSVKIRRANLDTNSATTTNYSSAINAGYLNRLTINDAGNRITTLFNCGGPLYINSLFDGSNFTSAGFMIMNRNICGQTTFDSTYPVASGTSVSTKVDWQIDFNRRPLNHTNGKFYFSTADISENNAMIYSSNGTELNVIAGVTGASGYVAGDSGNLASLATLGNVRAIFEVTSGKPNAGDLLIVDNNRLRLITITTESANPKIYDVVAFGLATGYGSNSSSTFTDVVYDFNSEMLNGSSQSIIGTGAMYYATSANVVRKFIVNSVSGNTPTGANDTAYNFTGTSLSGNIRLALTPSGLLVTQPSKNRILRVTP